MVPQLDQPENRPGSHYPPQHESHPPFKRQQHNPPTQAQIPQTNPLITAPQAPQPTEGEVEAEVAPNPPTYRTRPYPRPHAHTYTLRPLFSEYASTHTQSPSPSPSTTSHTTTNPATSNPLNAKIPTQINLQNPTFRATQTPCASPSAYIRAPHCKATDIGQ